ncbi:MAG: hypothetical protein COX62_00670 [Deltaproteobacteria bacterium CG_4_10_14_0_2_um_filter_43_8]|nr:MAG: hypothetical protein COV43_03715 [Deltaproteobacteria bacterium CG11_big_fil_rev_8_21_14_0_20_42_23]PJA22116.1 MAG: hypothetical protein COX62_00670 [Deltaproteobacteria bacterium CG_4_10_14_0_2_um_filter_43_8]PJC64830.1 MAG: hypothetical protein CO021_02325 [Deltaproteobacteria bacterium CG_4_9_14_0_2_um_filter_42_21]
MKSLVLVFVVSLFCFSSFAHADIAVGKAKYNQFCVACHGATGAGDGAASAALNPKPPSFRNKAFFQSRTDAHLAKVIKDGGAANKLSALMPAWRSSLSDAEIKSVIEYIHTFAK